jgi:S-adenosylmethionine:tRNA-ribosyltransferase-isomerase (queuine synthetase)
MLQVLYHLKQKLASIHFTHLFCPKAVFSLQKYSKPNDHHYLKNVYNIVCEKKETVNITREFKRIIIIGI